jgi:uncharacterized protein (DUF58 family)
VPTVSLPDDVRDRIARLGIAASTLVEGPIAGQHRSPYQGFSVEFAQHREYTWGDELKHVDWKVFARTDRYYVKQYEEETNLHANVLLDQSESMLYRGRRAAASKYEYGATIAAGLAFVLQRQQDAMGLYLFDDQVRRKVPPSAHPSQVGNLTRAMAEVELRGESPEAAPILHQVAEEMSRRGVIFIISDFFMPRAGLVDGIRHLRHRRHQVVVFHVLDPDERTFPFDDMTQFEGLELPRTLLCDPRALREAYLEALTTFKAEVTRACLDAKAEYVEVDTSVPPAVTLSSFLSQRQKRRGRG